MKKIWLIIILIAFSCDNPMPSTTEKKVSNDEIKLSNPWIDFQTQYKIKNKRQEGC